jgi:hypothetical protein
MTPGTSAGRSASLEPSTPTTALAVIHWMTRSVTARVFTIRITPPLRRDICAMVAARRPPTGAAQALLDILEADITSRRGQSGNPPSGKTPSG